MFIGLRFRFNLNYRYIYIFWERYRAPQVIVIVIVRIMPLKKQEHAYRSRHHNFPEKASSLKALYTSTKSEVEKMCGRHPVNTPMSYSIVGVQTKNY